MFVELGEVLVPRPPSAPASPLSSAPRSACPRRLLTPAPPAIGKNAQGDPDLIVVHDQLNFGHCHLAVAVPQGWSTVNSIQDLKNLGWSEKRPMRVVTGYTHVRSPARCRPPAPHPCAHLGPGPPRRGGRGAPARPPERRGTPSAPRDPPVPPDPPHGWRFRLDSHRRPAARRPLPPHRRLRCSPLRLRRPAGRQGVLQEERPRPRQSLHRRRRPRGCARGAPPGLRDPPRFPPPSSPAPAARRSTLRDARREAPGPFRPLLSSPRDAGAGARPHFSRCFPSDALPAPSAHTNRWGPRT